MRLFLFLLAGACLVVLQPAGAAGPNDSNLPPQQPICRHQPIVNGHPIQPRPGDLQCLDESTPPSQPLPHEANPTLDKDEAAILDILNRYRLPNTDPVTNSGR